MENKKAARVSFDMPLEERRLLSKVLKRVKKELRGLDLLEIEMDIVAVNANDVRLDLKKLLEFDEFNFAHDIYGINARVDRKTGKLTRCFLPRCAR